MQSQRRHFVDEHPTLSADIRNAIANGEILKGMNEEQVQASWGRPESVVTDQNGLARWTYYRRIGNYLNVQEVRFVSGKVEDIASYGFRESNSRIFSDMHY